GPVCTYTLTAGLDSSKTGDTFCRTLLNGHLGRLFKSAGATQPRLQFAAERQIKMSNQSYMYGGLIVCWAVFLLCFHVSAIAVASVAGPLLLVAAYLGWVNGNVFRSEE